MAPHLSHDEFFSSLANLLTKTSDKARGSVFLSQKPVPNTDADAPPSVVVRATDGNTGAPNPKSSGQAGKVAKNTSSKVKFSTIVSHNELEAFYARYADVCKTGMTGLKKRDRKRKAKAKGGAAKAKA
ncbi:signal recognition particle 14kD protein [Penicillium chermesinum]|uniref:Signal recognition particle subunit SRP14 n=1 Tax=Penicillium chermesinum TaxID=63820 RepID=A0A9W9NIE5_9EURO|nr:signal recognition particle 14kD protein [Penicillium chermesinum]KAJ5220406.1 signal recognition particle 14kD protein [Penicillium chermesinum]